MDQHLFLVDKEKKLPLRAIENTNVDLHMLAFATDKERELQPHACQAYFRTLKSSTVKSVTVG